MSVKARRNVFDSVGNVGPNKPVPMPSLQRLKQPKTTSKFAMTGKCLNRVLVRHASSESPWLKIVDAQCRSKCLSPSFTTAYRRNPTWLEDR